MRKGKIPEDYTFCGIGYLCERMISLRGDMSAENNEKHQK